MPLKTIHRVAPWAILTLFFISGVFVVHGNDVVFWLDSWRGGSQAALESAPLYVGVRDVEGPLGQNAAVVEVISADKSTRLDRILTTEGIYTAGSTALAQGTEIYLHVYAVHVYYNGGNSTYHDEWYHATVGYLQSVNRLRPGLGTRDAPAPIGQFDQEHYARMTRYQSGDREYWQINPTFLLQWRDNYGLDSDSKAGIAFSVQNPNGVSIRTATGLMPSPGSPDSAPADFTTTRPQFSIKLNVNLTDQERVYGRPMLFLGPPPDYQWRIGYLVIWISFNNTGIGTNYLTANDWTQLSQVSTPGYLNFYKVLPPIVGSLSTGLTSIEQSNEIQNIINTSIDISVDTSRVQAGTGISLRVWMADLQLPADSAHGIDDQAPVPYGPVGGYGVPETVFANGFRISSGTPANQLIWITFRVS